MNATGNPERMGRAVADVASETLAVHAPVAGMAGMAGMAAMVRVNDRI